MPATDLDELAGSVAQHHRPSVDAGTGLGEKTQETYAASMGSGSTSSEPTMEEMKTLRRVSGTIGWRAFSITFVEFCERFSWYGTTAGELKRRTARPPSYA